MKYIPYELKNKTDGFTITHSDKTEQKRKINILMYLNRNCLNISQWEIFASRNNKQQLNNHHLTAVGSVKQKGKESSTEVNSKWT